MARMLFACPHCDRPGIPARAKFFSMDHAPAKCQLCGGLSAESRRHAGLVGIAHYFGVLAAVGLAFVFRSWWPLAIYVVAAIASSVAILFTAPLLPLTAESVRKTYRLKLRVAAGVLVLLLLATVAGVVTGVR